MKTITNDLLGKNYAEYSALFFMDDGIVVDSQTSSPVVQFAKTAKELDTVS